MDCGRRTKKVFVALSKRQQRRRAKLFLENFSASNPESVSSVSVYQQASDMVPLMSSKENVTRSVKTSDNILPQAQVISESECKTGSDDSPEEHTSTSGSTEFIDYLVTTNTANEISFTNCEPLEALKSNLNAPYQQKNSSLKNELSSWAINSSLSREVLNKLLRVLIKHGHKDLPTDARTLLQTPRAVNTITFVNPGYYYHFGVEYSLINSIKQHFNDNFSTNIELKFNIDGLPISKSSGSQFWPILAQIHSSELYMEPFVVGIFHGNSKPTSQNEFLEPFINDMKVIARDGVLVNKKKIHVKIKSVICDAPARAFISGVKGHNAYFGCSKCIQEGEYIDHRVTYPEIHSPLRTDESFLTKLQEEHHRVSSILESLSIGMVSQLPLDYLHLVCLGVVKRLLQFWTAGKKNIRMNNEQIDKVSNLLLSVSRHIPKEFSRKPRSLKDVDRWKGTEFRQFLLYTGPVVLKNNLSPEKYLHFLSLHVAIKILISKDLYLKFNGYAQSLLEYFVTNYSTLYGEEYISYNVHNLVHICEDAKIHGPLDEFSTFPFENFLGKIKSKTRTSRRPLQQIVNRIKEKNLNEHKSKYEKSLESVQLSSNMYLTGKSPDNVCILQSSEIMIINSVTKHNNNIYLEGQVSNAHEPFFEEPKISDFLTIKKLQNTSFSKDIKIAISEINFKCMLLPVSSLESVVIPLIHFAIPPNH